MADYYLLLSRAVHELDTSTVEHRQALYERVRKVMTEQLRDQDLMVGELGNHHSALEEAIKRIEEEEERRERRLQTQRVLKVVRDEEVKTDLGDLRRSEDKFPMRTESDRSAGLLKVRLPPSDASTLFIPCENVRQELGGRLTLIGAAPGGELILPAAASVTNLVSLAFLFVFRDGEGTFSTSFSLFAPSGQALVDKFKLSDTIKKPNEPFNLIVHIAPFQTTESGQFRAVAKLDNRDYARTFFLRQASAG